MQRSVRRSELRTCSSVLAAVLIARAATAHAGADLDSNTTLPEATPPKATDPAPACGPKDAALVRKITLGNGDGMWRVLKNASLVQEDIAGALAALRKVANLDFVPPGRRLVLRTDAAGRLLSLEQRPSPTISQCVERNDARFTIRIVELAVETRVAMVSGHVGKSLSKSIEALGENASLAFFVRELFRGPRDPFAGAGPDDRFNILVEKQTVEGEIVGYGEILAAEYVRTDGKRLRAFYHQPDDSGVFGHYSEDGKPFRTRRLSVPIAGASISSNYGMRSHPVNGRAQAHHGLDFAAMEGTEVRAARDGVVELARSPYDLGNYICIEHDGKLVTRYAHLSRFAPGIRTGRWVKRGTLIGYVGKTGLTTGPHLHFETMVGGMHFNPARFLKANSTPLTQDQLTRFFVDTAQFSMMFDAIDPDSQPPQTAEAGTRRQPTT